MYIQKKFRRVAAAEDVDVEDIDVEDVEDVDVETQVSPEAADLLFEADDVAQLVAEVTGQPVEVDTDEGGSVVTFSVGEDVYTVEPEGDEEILESRGRKMRGKRPVRASRAARNRIAASRAARSRVATRRPVTASRVVRRIARKK